jgi:hypothetical protein
MRYELRSIGVWACVRTSFFLHLVFGFVIGLFYAAILGMMVALISSLPYGDTSDTGIDLSALGPVFIILLPILCSVGMAVFGTVFTAIFAVVYNLIVKMVGGIEFELEPITLSQVAVGHPSPVMPAVNSPYPPPPPPPSSVPPSGQPYNPPPEAPKYDWTQPPQQPDQPRGPEPEN